ncbi:MAG: hypothetical protein RLZZ387_1697 [Chloroflexota bacterium]|jgi:hypothetical protein
MSSKKSSSKGKPASNGGNGGNQGQFGQQKGGFSRGTPMSRRPPRQPGR